MPSEIRRVAVTGAAGYVGRSLIARLARDAAVDRILALDRAPAAGGRREGACRLRAPRRDAPVRTAAARAPHRRAGPSRLRAASLAGPRSRPPRQRRWRRQRARLVRGRRRAACPLPQQLQRLRRPRRQPAAAGTKTRSRAPPRGFQYSEDKAAAERLIADFAASRPGFSAIVLRACPALGPKADNFIASAFSKPFLVGARGHDPQMQLVHEDDLAEALCRCLLSRVSGTYNLAGDGLIRWSEMARMFGRRVLWLPGPLLRFLVGASWALRLQARLAPQRPELHHPYLGGEQRQAQARARHTPPAHLAGGVGRFRLEGAGRRRLACGSLCDIRRGGFETRPGVTDPEGQDRIT